VSIASRLKSLKRFELASLAFYVISGLVLLVFLPLTGFAPQLGLLGIISLIVAYGLFTKRAWTPYLLFVLLLAATTFSLYTLFSIGFSYVLIATSMIVYAVLMWVFAIYIFFLRRKA